MTTTITVRSVDPETQRTALVSNALFIQLRGATPAQINAYLAANVTNLAQALPVLSVLLQAVAYLVNKESAT
jgi:hypothetical protein